MIHGGVPLSLKGGGLRLCDKSGHTHASWDIPMKRPLGSKSGKRWGQGSNGHLFTGCLPTDIDKNSRGKESK